MTASKLTAAERWVLEEFRDGRPTWVRSRSDIVQRLESMGLLRPHGVERDFLVLTDAGREALKS